MEKDFETSINDIEISTNGLDNIVIENGTSSFISVRLFAENSNQQDIVIEEKNNHPIIKFQLDNVQIEEPVFRKFITKRLQRAYAIVRIPKKKI